MATAMVHNQRRRRTFRLGILALSLLLTGSLILGLAVGAVWVPLGDVLDTLWRHGLGFSPNPTTSDAIIWQIRAPRVVLGALAGAGLSLVGVAVQAMVRNPLADPYVMGIESGAAAAAAAAIYLGRTQAHQGTVTPTLAGFLGALATLVVVFGLSRKAGRVSPVRLLLVGVAVSYALGGITSFVLYASRNSGGEYAMMFWILGGLGGATWAQIPLALVIVTAGFGALWLHSRQLNALSIGDDSAGSLGLNPDRLRSRLLVICAVVVASLVSIVGPIGFVGLVVPHVGRLLFGADHRRLLPASLLIGASYLVLVDVVARVLFRPSELPIGMVTAVCGAPFFLWLIRRRGSTALQDAP